MNGPQHYREAERLLQLANDTGQSEVATSWQRDAQVHATLALAAATVEGIDSGLRPGWAAIVGDAWPRPR